MTEGPRRSAGRDGHPPRLTARGRLWRLTAHEARLLARALVEVLRARLGLSLHRHDALRARIARLAARTGAAGAAPPDASRADPAPAEVAWSVAAAARLVPGASCLTQALAGQALLARRGLASRIEVSLPAGGSGFRPHAWLIAEGKVLLGGTAADHARHRLLAAYPAGPDPAGERAR